MKCLADSIDVAINRLARTLDDEATKEFSELDRVVLRRAMAKCGLADLPSPIGDVEIACGEFVCGVCNQTYATHPLDWRLIGFGNVPFANVLCDGRRVKL